MSEPSPFPMLRSGALPWRAAWRWISTLAVLLVATPARASEADLVLPDFSTVTFPLLGGLSGDQILLFGVLVSLGGLAFGFLQFQKLRRLPIHAALREVSELIYSTCRTYLVTQGKFILWLQLLTAVVMVAYFGVLRGMEPFRVVVILLFSLIGIAGSYGVSWFGIRVNTFANGRTTMASLRGKPYPTMEIPLQAGMSIGMVLISVELLIMLGILLFVPRDLAGACFIGFAIGESLGASVLRIAGGIFTKIADIGADLMKIVFKIKEDDARNPGVIADCTGDNAGDSVGPSADGFETYGVTLVALITFTLLAVDPAYQVPLLVWIFAMNIVMLLASLGSYLLNGVIQSAKSGDADVMDFEAPLSSLVRLTSVLTIAANFLISFLVLRGIGDDPSLWWKLAGIVTCGTAAGALIPEAIKAFTSTKSRHVQEIVTSSREGGASLNVISGLVAGNFSGYWMGLIIVGLMGGAAWLASQGLGAWMIAEPVFAFGLVALGFLGMAPVTIAVDSYGPVTDNAQSVFELSLIETLPDIESSIEKEYGFKPNFDRSKELLEENDAAGNTFKATSKPVLIGTAVVGATTLIFSIIVMLIGVPDANGMVQLATEGLGRLSILNPLFLLGFIAGGAIIYWFSGASMQAVSTGAYRAVEFIKANIKLEGVEKASEEDSKAVVEICTRYAQKGMINIFLAVFFSTLAFACFDPYFFIGFLISIAIFGLYQAVFMANAGGAWDNAKKLVETELKAKGTPLHDATVVGDTVGDPFKDTSSEALNPVIKFTTLFGLLAVELAVQLGQGPLTLTLAAVFFAISVFFVYRSFYGMRIDVAPAVAADNAATVSTSS
jgi:K(+)-stimulated pyrophosphate-energized sodium pump